MRVRGMKICNAHNRIWKTDGEQFTLTTETEAKKKKKKKLTEEKFEPRHENEMPGLMNDAEEKQELKMNSMCIGHTKINVFI